MSLTLIDNIAIFDLIMELDLLFPIIVDPTSLFFKFLKVKNGPGLYIESNSIQENTIQNITAAITEGHLLCVVDFNKDLLSLIEPLLEWRYDQFINRVYRKHNFQPGRENISDEQDEIIVMGEPEKILFNGKEI